ncbi:MAG: signal peptidase I [Candidatus Harrisonbacteria bacterium CG10_big_fil_rev_8_21_14_0_10_40_38]|uniref:Signal peptidase I n=1 Tax=Candidatus Harrisonbacteria bacterium CG10_big_fil_rev_8_21_14_0_10_40_38 TaxID=1974583 RepID=A0A2H0UR47_9BACT|nr:MAG: signal peptidase I [Candidatus Harrisonbacteria bacterium CG10_big_fil_rev_8_21_14_0_10_40_38]
MKTIGNILIYFAIVGGLVFGLPKFLSWALDTPYPMAAITSGSMWPVLKKGDLVLVEGVKKDDLAVGDIIVFENKERKNFTIHRIVKLDDENITTKGDANFNEDTSISYKEVIGRAVKLGSHQFRIPYLGLVTVYASEIR